MPLPKNGSVEDLRKVGGVGSLGDSYVLGSLCCDPWRAESADPASGAV